MSGVRKPRWPLAAVLVMVGGFVALGAPAPAPAAGAPRVLMVDNEPDLTRWHYEPGDVTVPAGTTVVWFNKGKEDHSVTADDKSFDSGLKKTGGTFSRAFPRPGKYTYHCQPHPWMKGTVEVLAAAPTAASAAANPPSSAPTPTTAAAAPPAPAVTAPAAAPGSSAPGATTETTTAPDPAPGESSGDQKESDDKAAAPASESKRSGGHLARTLALVLLPTLGALALGAKLRQSRS
jgi:plastocyanin